MTGEGPRASFWDRQVAPETTPDQTAFDVLLGFLLPPLCFALDPVVFRASSSGLDAPPFDAPLQGGAAAIYVLYGLCALALGIWLVGRRGGILLYGTLMVGALASLAIGSLLLPLTILGSLTGIGLLGFTPFLTGYVLWRNGERARRQARERYGWGRVAILGLGLGIATVLASLGVQELGGGGSRRERPPEDRVVDPWD